MTNNLKEPDFRNVAKKLVRVEKPCLAELSSLMDCMKVRPKDAAGSRVAQQVT